MGINLNYVLGDNNTMLAIVAINMTIIGLTSLAETKNIIGIDYGKFLVRSYKVFNCIRMYYLLINFALINSFSLLSMFFKNSTLTIINFIILLFSLIFAIYYFFSYILIENKYVKKQIYEQELIGLYYDSDNKTTFEADLIAEMSNGSRTDKKLSSNVITYFDNFNYETQKAFEEVFGVESIIYNNTKRTLKVWKERVGQNPYNYYNKSGIKHISHEFFQLYRYSNLQDKWLLEILRIFNGDYTKNHADMRQNNILRVLAHINRFGSAENLYKYKFLEYITPYIFDALNCEDSEKNIEIRNRKEEFILKEFLYYIFYSINKTEDEVFFNTALISIKQIFFNNKTRNYLDVNQKMRILFTTGHFKSAIAKNFVVKIYNMYWEFGPKNKMDIQQVREIIMKDSDKDKKEFTVRDIFENETDAISS